MKALRLGVALSAALASFTDSRDPAEQATAADQVAALLSERAASWGRSDYSAQQAGRDLERAAVWRGIAAQRRRVAAARAAVASSAQTLGGPDWGGDPPREQARVLVHP